MTYWTQLQKAGYRPSKITTACEADCSAGVIANTRAAGYLLNISKLKDLKASYTGDMRTGYKNAGFEVLTDSKYTTSTAYLLPGDILLNEHSIVNDKYFKPNINDDDVLHLQFKNFKVTGTSTVSFELFFLVFANRDFERPISAFRRKISFSLLINYLFHFLFRFFLYNHDNFVFLHHSISFL